MKEYKKIESARTPSFRVNMPFGLEREDVKFLQSQAFASQHKVARFVLHETNESLVHEMIILKLKEYEEAWIRQPLCGSKTFIILEGDLTLKFKDAREEIQLSSCGQYRFRPDLWHRFEIHSKRLLYCEILEGPLSKSQTEYINGHQFS